jgi:hypothetical protein
VADHVGIINAAATAAYKAAQTGCEIDITIGSGRSEVKVHIRPGAADVALEGAPEVAVPPQPPFDQDVPKAASEFPVPKGPS